MRNKLSRLMSVLVILVMVCTIQIPGIVFAEDDAVFITATSSDPGSEEGSEIDPASEENPDADPGSEEDTDSGTDLGDEAGLMPAFAMMPMEAAKDLYVGSGSTDATHFDTIKAAVDAATSGAVIHVERGTFREEKIIIDKDLSIIGEDKQDTIISPSQDFTGSSHSDDAAWFVVNSGVEFNLSNVTLDGGTVEGNTRKDILVAIMSHGSGVIENNIFRNIYGGDEYKGVAIELYGSDMTVRNNSFSNIQRIGVFIRNNAANPATISGNEYTGKNSGDWLDYAFEVGWGGNADISGNRISQNRGIARSDNSSSAGIQVTTFYGSGTRATIRNNTISDCSVGVLVGYDERDTSMVTVNENHLNGNDIGIKSTAPTVNGKKNWWGTNTAADIQAKTYGEVVYEPFYTSETMSELAYIYKVVNETKEVSHETIQGAIDAADDGDTIHVAPGTYNERISIAKPLTLLGATHGEDKTGADYDNVTNDGSWVDPTKESVIQAPDSSAADCVVDIKGTSDITFDGFVVQELHASGNALGSLVRVSAKEPPRATIQNINVTNNVIGPFTNIEGQDGTHGRMGLYIINDPYNDSVGVTNSTFAHNKIFGAEGNGNNVFIWSAYHDYGADGPCPMTGTVIEENDIYGANRSGIETAGGFKDLIIRNNLIHDNGISTSGALTHGNGILLIRGAGDKTDSSGFGPENLTIQDNEIYNNAKNGIYSGPMIKDTLIKGNDIRDNGWHGVVVDLEEQYHGGGNPVYGRAAGVALTGNTITGNSTGAAVQGTPTNGFIMKAVKNWWGTNVTAEIQAAVSNSVTFDPWYAGEDMDLLASTQPVINETKGTVYNSIQAAIDDAAVQDVIYVTAGTYNENVNINKNGLILKGAGAANTKIIATDGNSYPLKFSANNATVEGFTLTHAYTDAELAAWTFNNSGVFFEHDHTGNTLRNCTVTLNRNGIYLNDTQNNRIINNVITNNRTGINMTNNVNGTRIEGNTISDNWTIGLVAYSLGGSANLDTVSVIDNTFSNNWYSEILIKDATDFSGTLNTTNNIFTDSPVTYSTSSDASLNEPGWSEQMPAVAGIGGSATRPRADLPTLRIYNSGSVVLKYDKPKTLRVGGAEYQTIQAAIDAASTGDIIRVPAGTYNEALSINESVELRGAQYNVDARDRNVPVSEESTVTGGIVNITADGAIIDGFAFTPPVWEGRIAPVADDITMRNNIIERALYHSRSSDPIENFTLSQNWFKNITDGGSAIVMEGATEDLTIEDNLFTDIDYSAIILGATSYEGTVISGNAIYRTQAQGINLGADHDNTTVSNNYIEQANISGEPDKGGIRIYGTDFTGPVSITGNTVVNSFNGFCVRDGGNITGKAILVENNSFTENRNAGIYNGASSGAVNAANNYWGGGKPAAIGNVRYFPWYVDEGKTRLSNQGFNLASPSKGKSSVTLKWAAVPGADGYNIYNGETRVNTAIITGSSFTVTGLSSSTTYTFSLKIVEGEKEYLVSDPALSVTTSSGGGGTKPPEPPSLPPAPAALTDPQTKDDQTLSDALKSTGQASLDLTKTNHSSAGLSTNTITQLAQERAPLVIRNTGVQLDFAPKSLITQELTNALNQPDAIVELGARQISEEEKQEILAGAPLGESTGIFEVGGAVVDLSAQIVSGNTGRKIEEFAEPVAVTIDLSGLNLTPEQIGELSGVRFEKDETGNIVPVPLGGSYDPKTKTFTFYTARFSLYSVLQVSDLVKVELTIGNGVARINGIEKSIDVPPGITNSRTMVPLRFIGEALGTEFEWDEKTRTVSFNLNGKELQVVIDQRLPGMDVPASIVNNRTIVPIRYIAEAFGAEVTWFPSERKVMIVNN